MRKIKVDLGIHSYDILIGRNILDEAAEFIANSSSFTKKVLIVTDSNIIARCAGKFTDALSKRNINFETAVIPAGESSKSLQEAEKLYTRAIEMGMDRKSVIIALGGGVVGDLAGFVAATFMRGIPFIQIPTSLLAQVDSSVGGKVAVNHQLGKNLIGAFYQPKAVFIDLDFLATLPPREIKSGLGEIVKYGIIRDAEFFAYIEDNVKKILQCDLDVLEHLIYRSCQIKAEVVSADEREAGERMILNFGHTIAHAIEAATNYKVYSHGEAVSVGMVGAAIISNSLKLIDLSVVSRIQALLDNLNLVTKINDCSVDELFNLLLRDKKTFNGKVHWVLINQIGSTCINSSVPSDIVKNAIFKISGGCRYDNEN